MDTEVPSSSNVDPLSEAPSTITSATSESDQTEATTIDNVGQYTQEQLVEILSKRTEVDFSDDMMDPIEWSVRKVVPLPAVYYWDLLKDQPKEVSDRIVREKIPRKIKLWHNVVAALDKTQTSINNWVAQPIANGLGITGSRIGYVTDNMTKEEMAESKRIIVERKQQQQKMMNNIDDTTNDDNKNNYNDNDNNNHNNDNDNENLSSMKESA